MSMLSSGSCDSGPDGSGQGRSGGHGEGGGYLQSQTKLLGFMTLKARGCWIFSRRFFVRVNREKRPLPSSRPSIRLSVCLHVSSRLPQEGNPSPTPSFD